MCKTTIYNDKKYYRLGGAWIDEQELQNILENDLYIVTRKKAVSVSRTKNGSYKASIYCTHKGRLGYVGKDRYQIVDKETIDRWNSH